MRRAPRSETVGTFFKVRFKDRLQNQQRCHLDDPVAHRGNAQRSQFAVGLGNVHPLDWPGPIRLLPEFPFDFIQKPFRPAFGLFDPFYAYPVHAGRTLIGAHPVPSRPERFPVTDPPVERVEAELGFLFGLWAQLLSQLKEFRRQGCLLPGSRLGPHPFRFFRSGVLLWITQSALPSSDSALSALQPLGSTVITRFPATMGCADSRARFRPVIDSLAELAPVPLPPKHGSLRFLTDPRRSRCPP